MVDAKRVDFEQERERLYYDMQITNFPISGGTIEQN